MNCSDFMSRLEEFAAGTMPAADLLEAGRHLALCPRCGELAKVVHGDLGLMQAPHDADAITRAVLERTSGPACGAAEGRLCGFVDGILPGADAELVRLHLDHCPACRELAFALAWTTRELPVLADIDPGPQFIRRVIDATSRRAGRSAPAPGADRAPRLARLRDWTAGLIRRPRFALEAAYGGALIVWLLSGAPTAPWREVRERALALGQVNAVRVIEASAVPVPGWVARPVVTGRRMLAEAGGPVLEGTRASRAEWARRLRRAEAIGPALGAEGRTLLRAAARGDFAQGAACLKELGAQLGSIWQVLFEHQSAEGSAMKEV